MLFRDAIPTDALACARIYRPYVEETAISFELVAPDEREMRNRIEHAQRAHSWIVAEKSGLVVGYGYGTRYRAREAYRHSCEVSLYIAAEHHGQGIGSALYQTLFGRLTERTMRTAIAGIALPNSASEHLHRKCGFQPVGVLRGVGYKWDRWHDVAFFQKDLGRPSDNRAVGSR